MTLRQLSGKIHLWLGLPSGLVVFVVAITGCLYVFEEELLDVFDRDVRFVEAAGGAAKLPPSRVFEAARGVLGPGYGMFLINYADPERSYQVWAWNKEDPEEWIGAYMNPYTGEVLEHYDYHASFWSTVVHLHTTLLLPHEVGRIVVGTATLIFIVLLVSGLVLWFPANKKVFRTKQGRRSRFGITWGLSPKRLNYDLHSVLGFYLSWVVVFIALTGLVMSFSWVRQGVYWLASGETSVPDPIAVQSTQPPAAEGATTTLDAIYARVLADHGAAHGLRFYEPADAESAVRAYVYLDEGTYYRHVELHFDQYTGKLLHEGRFEEGNAGDKLLRMNYDIHTGAILGLPGRLLAFFASLLTASLPVTGFLVWWGQRKKIRPARPGKTEASRAVRPVRVRAVSADLDSLPAAAPKSALR